MEEAELIGIDEKELRGFLIALLERYNSSTEICESGIEPILSKFIDCETKTNWHTSFQLLIRYQEYLHGVPQRA